jgi:Uma2 family endonuclease
LIASSNPAEEDAVTDITPPVPHEPTRFSVAAYFRLLETGALTERDRVELLEGVIVAMTPSNPPHAGFVTKVSRALFRAVGERASVRTQCPLILQPRSVPEPDVAVVAGCDDDYLTAHPESALLVVEVADSSLPQDRLSKSRIYAQAAIPEYWIINLRDGVLEVMRDPVPSTALYRDQRTLRAGDRVEVASLPGASIEVAELLPRIAAAPES